MSDEIGANASFEVIQPQRRFKGYRDHYHPLTGMAPVYPVGSDEEEFDRYFDTIVSRIRDINNAYADFSLNGARSLGRYLRSIRSYHNAAHNIPSAGLKEFVLEKKNGFIIRVRIVSGPLDPDANPDIVPTNPSCSSESQYSDYPTAY